jgi:hypothetical protein
MAKDVELHLQRTSLLADRTLGSLTKNGAFVCFTCEDVVRAAGVKVHGATAIPAGRYQLINSESKHFGKLLPEVLRVPGFAGIRCHGGNGPADTEGCILLGRHQDSSKIWDCAPAVQLLIDVIELATEQRGRVFLTIC